MAHIQIVTVPDIGDVSDVEVAELLVAVGARVEADDPLISLESDKATMDVPSTVAGVVAELLVVVGDQVKQGSPIAKLEVSGDAPLRDGVEAHPAAPEHEEDALVLPGVAVEESRSGDGTTTAHEERASALRGSDLAVDEEAFRLAHASPGVRRFARELGVDLGSVAGSGRKGRIIRDDVTDWVKARLASSPSVSPLASGVGIPPLPEIDFSVFGPVEEVRLSKIRRVAAENLRRAWLNVPHVTQHDEADVTDLEAFRKEMASQVERLGYKLTPLAFILKACVAALKDFPDFNASLSPDGHRLIRKGYYHFGIAVDTPAGLVVPVIRDVDQKGVEALARELAELGVRTRDRKIGLDELQGASFSVSNLGGLGGTGFTPIVNAPEVAILGVSRTQIRPRWTGEGFEPRKTLPLSLSYDHRVIDGAAAARFTSTLVTLLSDIRRLVL